MPGALYMFCFPSPASLSLLKHLRRICCMNIKISRIPIAALAGGLMLAACSDGASTAAPQARAQSARSQLQDSADNLVVVELFQSQGCSSCPPANANVNAIAGRPDILALSYSVTYWDRLGWRDTFAKQAFNDRQVAYANGSGNDQVYTPQIVINGGAPIVGSNADQLRRVIAERGPLRGGPAISVAAGSVTVGEARSNAAATVWLVRYDPAVRQVPIRAGENNGRTLPHRNIVHDLINLGSWNGRNARYALRAAPAGLRSAILVQRGEGGPIIAARKF